MEPWIRDSMRDMSDHIDFLTEQRDEAGWLRQRLYQTEYELNKIRAQNDTLRKAMDYAAHQIRETNFSEAHAAIYRALLEEGEE